MSSTRKAVRSSSSVIEYGSKMLLQQHCRVQSSPLRSRYVSTKFGLWLFIFVGIFCPFLTQPAWALQINSHMKYYYVAKDSSVTLNCEFVLESENMANLEIEWNLVPPSREQDDKIIIWYTGGMIYNNLYEPLKNRVSFAAPDPPNGIASLRILDLKLTDTGTYQCMVKKLPELGIKKIILLVMERPSKPVCSMDAEAVAGEELRLRCRSSKGTPPLDYSWSKTSGNQKLPQSSFVDTLAGDLYLRKITGNDCGTYRCTVKSLVGVEECEVKFNLASSPTVNYGPGTTAGIAASVVVAIAIMIMIIRAIICYRRTKNEEEFGNEILVDELPPRTHKKDLKAHLAISERMDGQLKNQDKQSQHKVIEDKDLELLSPSKSESAGTMRCGAVVRGEALPEKMEDSVTVEDQDIHLPHP